MHSCSKLLNCRKRFLKKAFALQLTWWNSKKETVYSPKHTRCCSQELLACPARWFLYLFMEEKPHVKSYTLFALWLSQHFAFCSFRKRNTQPRAISWHLLCPSTQSSHINTHIKDFKPSNIQDSNEELSWQLSVQGLVDTDHQPFEHSVVHCLR